MPIPPSRASAIAIRASVTVSIAAETIGMSSAIVRVSRVAVETSFGSTADSAGTSSTSSKVRPSFAELLGAIEGRARPRPLESLDVHRDNATARAGWLARPAQTVSRPRRSSVTSTPAWSRCAWRGSKRPAPSSSVDAAPAATAARSCSSGGRPALPRGEERRRAARRRAPTVETGSTRGATTR